MKVAVVDLGTNTCRLFLAEVGEAAVTTVDRVTTVVRLGQGVDSTRRLAPEAVARTRACLAAYAERLEEYASRAASAGGDQRAARRRGWPCIPRRRAARLRSAVPGARRQGGGRALVPRRHGRARPGVRPGGARRHRRRQHRVRRRPAGRTPRAWFAASTSASCASPSASCGMTRRRRGSWKSSQASSARPSPTACPPRRGARSAAWSASPARTRRSSPTSSTSASTARTSCTGTSFRWPTSPPPSRCFAALSNAERGRLTGIQKGREDVILAGTLIAREACAAFGLDAVRVSEADILEGAAQALAEGTLSSG